ncbi:glycoside hydrolase family 36 protein [Paenibacillus sp. 2RAB27]|uniref:glycoside hydrolase family 36 protein n=1 Tax=Paenibacillus sp. 2RAB27 TaxID=3232991 RepID=UPI003F97C5CE
MKAVHVQDSPYQFVSESEQFHAKLSVESYDEGIEFVHIQLQADQLCIPSVMQVSWSFPICDVTGVWHPNGNRNRSLIPDWQSGFSSRSTNSAPVVSLFSGASNNRMTFAFSDTLNAVVCKAGVNEENAIFNCSITLFEELSSPIRYYEATLRVDRRNIAYYDSLRDVQQWWCERPGLTPSQVPAAAREPMYSTWYSFHQNLKEHEIEEQCRLARGLGCTTVIVDDGWQTTNNERGYAYCGDWEVCADKIDDMKAHVARVHAMDMKYMLWYSVPYIGKHSEAWVKFQDKMLYTIDSRGFGVIDPRYPEAREYLIGIYEAAIREWELDGLKLDFVDSFRLAGNYKHEQGSGMDYVSVPEAVDRLMITIMERLRQINPEVMIEFRQCYVGPNMRKYGNMFRAGDCPNDFLENRIRTIDIRLLCGDTAAHSDMLMWSKEEPVESAALQFINVLFAVPQLSVLLDSLPDEHLEMVSYWLEFWNEHKQVLLDGHLEPYNPELLYPLVIASDTSKLIAAVYNRMVISLNRDLPPIVILINGSHYGKVYVEVDLAVDKKIIEIKDCKGNCIKRSTLMLEPGIHAIDIPRSGMATLYSEK